jgi:myo-inositol 2-dehydrogenase/D-chiro-inositol 1-dehydrogenase
MPGGTIPGEMAVPRFLGAGRSTSFAMRFADGAVGSLIGSYDSSYAYGGTHMLEINGTKGRVLIEDTVRRYTNFLEHPTMPCRVM